MMIRRAIEELCDDLGAGSRRQKLFERIPELKTKITLPEEFIDGLHNIRYLGNDAAHVDARTYEDVGRDEVEAALRVTKVLVQSAYQYRSVLAALDGLKKHDDREQRPT